MNVVRLCEQYSYVASFAICRSLPQRKETLEANEAVSASDGAWFRIVSNCPWLTAGETSHLVLPSSSMQLAARTCLPCIRGQHCMSHMHRYNAGRERGSGLQCLAMISTSLTRSQPRRCQMSLVRSAASSVGPTIVGSNFARTPDIQIEMCALSSTQ